MALGTFNYISKAVNNDFRQFNMRGIINVIEPPLREGNVAISINGIEPSYDSKYLQYEWSYKSTIHCRENVFLLYNFS